MDEAGFWKPLVDALKVSHTQPAASHAALIWREITGQNIHY